MEKKILDFELSKVGNAGLDALKGGVSGNTVTICGNNKAAARLRLQAIADDDCGSDDGDDSDW